jgi:hypothetical protein
MSTNMDLWKRVSKTDPSAVKPITGKQYSGNSPKPYWIVQRLTEEFGPCGLGWGFTILNERMERLTEDDILHVAVVRLWYMAGERRCELEQIGQTKAVYRTGKGNLLVDEDAPKKSVTDALVKCASYLGFAGDIFSGRWDDSKYVESVRKEYEEKHSLERQLEASIEAAKRANEAKRAARLDEFALQLIEWHRDGKDMEAIKAWYDPASFDADHGQANEDRLYVWSRLKTESKLRSTIKANRPEHIDAGKETA